MTRVQFNWERRPPHPAADELRRVVVACLERLDAGSSEVHVLVTGDATLRELNRVYLGNDRATDVLSFPDGDLLPSGRRLLGQVVISLDTAKRQAVDEGHSLLRELSELLLHGTLHLLGYDHASDQGQMNSIELELREDLLS